ncbi:hypothetical protein Gpo141_00001279 [Globisporangium polare]
MDEGTRRQCGGCERKLAFEAFSRNQLAKESAKCKECVASMLQQAVDLNSDAEPRLKRCVQCFQDLEKSAFSKRQLQSLDGKCIACVSELERAASSTSTINKWSYEAYYRSCHRGKTGGVAVRIKSNIASPILGFIPLGRVFCATAVIYNEQGDPMVKLASLSCVEGISEENRAKQRDGWVPCRSIRNEIFVELHAGPFDEQMNCKYYRCVIEGCKARSAPDLELSELGYVLYGDVVKVVEARVSSDGLVFLRLHSRYFDGPAWVVERTLDNESVLNEVEGPSVERAKYRCVQESGAPTRLEPSLSSPPTGRIQCGAVVMVVERIVNAQRQMFLRLETSTEGGKKASRRGKKATKKSDKVVADTGTSADDVEDSNKDDEQSNGQTNTSSVGEVWVIETSTCCASVLTKLPAL